MFYKLKGWVDNRNSKKNLKKKIDNLQKKLDELELETLGRERANIWYLGFGKAPKDESLQAQINDLKAYLNIEYTEEKLAPKPKEVKKSSGGINV